LSLENQNSPHVERVIGGLGGFAIVAGSMLGIGIFLSPSIVAAHAGSPAVFLAVWALGGLTALAGAVACAELGTMMPRAGGDYVFQYEAYGPSLAFASGWVLFAAIFCGSIATMSVGICQYQLAHLTGLDLSAELLTLPWGTGLSGAHVAALILVPLVTGLNALGAQPSARTQIVLTLLPTASLAAMAGYGVVAGGAPDARVASEVSTDATLHGLVVAYMSVYFAYSGWINVIYVAGEVREPNRNIPRALIGGTLVITALYLALCWGFLRVLGLDGIRDAGEVGTATAGALGGPVGRLVVTFLIAAALLASINATVLGGARVAYAMALRGAIWPTLGAVGREHHVPHRALWLQAAVSMGLILSGRFEQLLSMVSLAMVLTGMLTVGSVFVLRRRRAELPRPYRATWYPLLPGIYVISSVVVLVVMARQALSNAPGAWYPLLGLAILAVAFLGHRVARGGSAGTREHRGR
jgi:APA family basic amino acid/polyamine antiporter